MREFVAVA